MNSCTNDSYRLLALTTRLSDTCHYSLTINGYNETSKGNLLNFEILENNVSKKNNKYSNEEIEYVKSFRNQKNITLVKVKKYFKRDKDKIISTSTISKIWKNLY